MWSPPTLQEALDNNESISLPSKTPQGMSRDKYQCDCSLWCWPFQILDTRNKPEYEQDWTCDGCWTKMMRKNQPPDDNPNEPTTRAEWQQRFIGRMGANVALQNAIGQDLRAPTLVLDVIQLEVKIMLG